MVDSVIEGKTGLFFDRQTPAALAEAVRRFESGEDSFDAASIRAHADTFDQATFSRRFEAAVLAAGDAALQEESAHQCNSPHRASCPRGT